jgi:transposase InsO family protein
LKRDFTAGKPFEKPGTDVTEVGASGGKAYLALVYDMTGKEIVVWDVSRHPNLAQQQRLLTLLRARLPEDAHPILHSDMGWRYRHRWWRRRLKMLGIRQSTGRKGTRPGNAATE